MLLSWRKKLIFNVKYILNIYDDCFFAQTSLADTQLTSFATHFTSHETSTRAASDI